MHPSSSFTESLKNELAAEVLVLFGSLRLRVTGTSMLPLVQPGDFIQVSRCAIQDVRAGDLVLFIRQRRLFAHRVVARCGGSLVAQGDTLHNPDPVVTAAELLGKVERIERQGRAWRPQGGRGWPARIAAAVFRSSPLACRAFTRLQALRFAT
jgi:hypothetical protein